jgi:hypothetical protein
MICLIRSNSLLWYKRRKGSIAAADLMAIFSGLNEASVTLMFFDSGVHCGASTWMVNGKHGLAHDTLTRNAITSCQPFRQGRKGRTASPAAKDLDTCLFRPSALAYVNSTTPPSINQA